MLVTHACPECGAPAEQIDRFVLASTDGPVPHVALHCARNHHFRMPVDMLPAPSAPALSSPSATKAEPPHRLSRLSFIVSSNGGLSQAAQEGPEALGQTHREARPARLERHPGLRGGHQALEGRNGARAQ